MVNIHISSEAKEKFKSKNAIQKFKNFLKENLDTGLVTSSEYLKEGCNFEFKEEDNIHVEVKAKDYVWGSAEQQQQSAQLQPKQAPIDPRARIKQRLRELRDLRTGRHHREMRTMKKTVDRDVLEKYVRIYKTGLNIPIPKPNEILDDPEKYRQQIEVMGSGFVAVTKNPQIDGLISDYFKTVAKKVGIEVMTMEKLKQMAPPQQQQQAPPQNFDLPSNIDLAKYVDSDTESESSDDEEEKEKCCDEKDNCCDEKDNCCEDKECCKEKEDCCEDKESVEDTVNKDVVV